MTINCNKKSNTLIIEVGRITDTEVLTLKSQVGSLLDDSIDEIIFDMKETKEIRSVMIGTMISFYKLINERGGKLSIINASNKLKDVFTLTRVDQIIEIKE